MATCPFGLVPNWPQKDAKSTERTQCQKDAKSTESNAKRTQNQPKARKTKPKASLTNKLFNFGVGVITSVKKVQVKYTENNGSYIPGYTNDVGFFGTLKPSFGYTFGSQSDELRYEAAKKGWLTLYPTFNEQYTSSKNRQLSISANLEPIKKLKIDLNANRAYQHNYTENYLINNADVNGENGQYQALTPNTFGSFNISTILIKIV